MVKLQKKSLSRGSFRTHGRVIGNKNFFIFGLTYYRQLTGTQCTSFTITDNFSMKISGTEKMGIKRISLPIAIKEVRSPRHELSLNCHQMRTLSVLRSSISG